MSPSKAVMRLIAIRQITWIAAVNLEKGEIPLPTNQALYLFRGCRRKSLNFHEKRKGIRDINAKCQNSAVSLNRAKPFSFALRQVGSWEGASSQRLRYTPYGNNFLTSILDTCSALKKLLLQFCREIGFFWYQEAIS
jgi:hypothetical protein